MRIIRGETVSYITTTLYHFFEISSSKDGKYKSIFLKKFYRRYLFFSKGGEEIGRMSKDGSYVKKTIKNEEGDLLFIGFFDIMEEQKTERKRCYYESSCYRCGT